MTVAIAAAQDASAASAGCSPSSRSTRRCARTRARGRSRARGGRRARRRARRGRRHRRRRCEAGASAATPWRCASRRPRRRRARRRSPSRTRSRASTACAPARSRSRPTCSPTRATCARRSARRTRCVIAAHVARARRPPGRPALGRRARGGGPRPARAAARRRVARPHDDPDPARRVARRILQRLNGMGKWGGYHTEFAHLARGFAGNDRELAEAVGEALLDAGPARREAERRPAPRVPQPAPRRATSTRSSSAASPRRTSRCREDVGSPHVTACGRIRQQALHRAARSRAPGSSAPTRPDKLVRTALRAARAGARRPPPGYTASAIRHPDETALVDELGTLTFARGPPAHERARPRAAATAGSCEGDGVAIMCRNHRGFVDATVALLEARRPRAVPQHRVRRPADHRRRRARAADGDRLRRGVRGARATTPAGAASASSPGTTPSEPAKDPRARGPRSRDGDPSGLEPPAEKGRVVILT